MSAASVDSSRILQRPNTGPLLNAGGARSSGTITTSQISTKAQAHFNVLFTGTNSLPTDSVAATCTASTSIDPTNTTPTSATSGVLPYCARSNDKFYLVTPANPTAR
ncbi:hypothetical protein XI09_41765 [Bradyrhizobium sp. CCBAU 11386]|nr:hypothetical protein [Bradyrhizobium sp. CCBAU 11386]